MSLESTTSAAIEAVFEQHNIDVTPGNLEHFEFLMKCLKLHNDRTRAYGTVWKRYGALSNLLSAARKVDRLMESWWRRGEGHAPALHKDNMDDALDAVNYLVFMMRNARAGNVTGDL